MSHADTVDLVSNYLALERLPDRLRTMVLDKGQGNPFLVEEFLQELIEEGVLERAGEEWRATRVPDDLEIPATLEGLIAARIDRLDPTSKTVLQAASVIGRSFSELLLSGVVDVGPGTLESLERRGFLVRGRDASDWTFKHVITLEVAYRTALRRRRRELHRRVAVAIEAAYPGEVELRAAELGRHYDLAGDPETAVHHLGVAATRAVADYAGEAALTLVDRALALTADPEIRFGLLIPRSQVLGLMGRHDEELAAGREMVAMAQDAGDPGRRLAGLEAITRALASSDYRAAEPAVAEALVLADERGDHRARARLLRLVATLQFNQYSPVPAREALEEALRIFEQEGMLAERADALANLARAVNATDPGEGESLARSALEAAIDVDDPRLRAGALTHIGLLALQREDPEAGIASLSEASRLAEEIGDMAAVGRAQLILGHAHAMSGDLERADRHFDTALETAERTGAQMPWLYGAMARVEHWESRHRFAQILEWLERILPDVSTRGHRHHLSYVHYAMGYRSLRWLGRLDEALDHVETAIVLTGDDDWIPPAVMFRNARAALLPTSAEPATRGRSSTRRCESPRTTSCRSRRWPTCW